MAKDKNHVYSVDLDVKSTAASKQTFKELQNAFESSNKNMDALNNSYMWLERHTKDTAELEKQYNKIIKAQLDARDEEIEKLKAKKVNVLANARLTQQERLEELKALDENIKSLETEKQQIKAKKEELKLRIKESRLLEKTQKIFKRQFNEESKKYKLAKNVVKLQEKLVGALSKESKLRKAINKTLSGTVKLAGKLAKISAGMAGGALALGGALAGAVAGQADTLVEKEQAMASLKSGIDPSVVDDVYIKTGKDYESIVAAINSLSDVTKDNASLVQGAVLELANPGAGKLLLSTSKIGANNGDKLSQAISQIKKQTGIQDMSEALEAAAKSWSVSTKKVSQVDYLQAYAALQQRGFDGEQIEKIIKDISLKKGSFIENLNKADLRKYTNDEQMKIRLTNAPLELQNLGLGNKSVADNMLRLLNKPQKSQAQSTAEKLRELELKKNELLVRFLPVLEAVVDGLKKVLDSDMAKKIADGLVSFLTTVIPGLVEWVPRLIDAIETIAKKSGDAVDAVTWNLHGEYDKGGTFKKVFDKAIDIVAWNFTDLFKDKGVSEETKAKIADIALWSLNDLFRDKGTSGGAKAQGGIVTSPALVGEAGPELVLPLDYSRAGRTSQIIQNFNTNQSFNMASNQQTPLAFSQAVGNNRFVTRVNGL